MTSKLGHVKQQPCIQLPTPCAGDPGWAGSVASWGHQWPQAVLLGAECWLGPRVTRPPVLRRGRNRALKKKRCERFPCSFVCQSKPDSREACKRGGVRSRSRGVGAGRGMSAAIFPSKLPRSLSQPARASRAPGHGFNSRCLLLTVRGLQSRIVVHSRLVSGESLFLLPDSTASSRGLSRGVSPSA